MAGKYDIKEQETLYKRLTNNADPKIKQETIIGKRIGLYKVKQLLGTGSYGKVKQGIHLLTNEAVAIKMMDIAQMNNTSLKVLSSEIACMERLCHPNIVRLFEVIDRHQSLNLVMECAAGGDLLCRIKEHGPMEERLRRRVFIQIASAVSYMHDHSVMHRDLKAENVYFSNPTTVKLGDFGLSTIATPTEYLETYCGSPAYSSPEIFRSEPYLGPCVDVWALGILLYFMSSGNVPFHGDTVQEIKEKVLVGTYHMPSTLSSLCQALVAGMLQHQCGQRYSMEQVTSSEWILSESCHLAPPPKPATEWGGKELDQSVLAQMKGLGVPLEDTSPLLGEPRTPPAGIYRILLQRKMEQVCTVPDQLNEGEGPPAASDTRVVVTLTHDRSCSCCGGRLCVIL